MVIVVKVDPGVHNRAAVAVPGVTVAIPMDTVANLCGVMIKGGFKHVYLRAVLAAVAKSAHRAALKPHGAPEAFRLREFHTGLVVAENLLLLAARFNAGGKIAGGGALPVRAVVIVQVCGGDDAVAVFHPHHIIAPVFGVA